MTRRKKKAPRIRPCNRDKKSAQPQTIKDNGIFYEYYKSQKILSDKDLEELITTMKTDLPITFRINPNEPFYDVIKNRLKTEFQFERPVFYEDKVIENPFPLPWYPDESAWQINISRKNMRKCEAFSELHKLLISWNDSGHITRQEAVSMIPVLMLHPQPNDIVLDMCAAPGSKTLQLLHSVHGQGIVVANDADSNRAYLLVHQTHQQHRSNLLVTSHYAQNYPDYLKIQQERGIHFDFIDPNNNYLYDRVLCDVPCSGDGTLRKQPMLFNTFSPKTGRLLFSLQRAILYRGLSLLKIGGTLVYSTCSLNPIEDEAVVSSIVGQYKNELEIVDIYNKEYYNDPYYGPIIQNLKSDCGVSYWNVYNNKMKLVESYEDVNDNEKIYYNQHMFNPGQDLLNEIHIERCMRFYPHRQNTGGFFVCVIRKLKDMVSDDTILMEIPSKEKITSYDSTNNLDESKTNQLLNTDNKVTIEKTYVNEERLYPWDQKEKETILDFYGFDPSFDWNGIYCRSAFGKILVYIHPTIRQLILHQHSIVGNDITRPCSIPECALVHTGLRLFQLNTTLGVCPYRLCQESSSFIKRYITKRKIHVYYKDMIDILNLYTESKAVNELPTYIGEQIQNLEMGSCIFELDGKSILELSSRFPSFQKYYKDFACVFWKGNNKISLLVTKVDIDTMLRVLLM